MSLTLDLTLDLLRQPSVTPEDAGCQEVLIARLEALGFRVERLRFGDVDNFWARFGDREPLFAFAGHTDVVPTGPLEEWKTQPFVPTVVDGRLFGRGAADTAAPGADTRTTTSAHHATKRFMRLLPAE